MKKLLTLLLLGVLSTTTLFADEPFRNHRYDSFKVLAPDSESIVFIGNSITDMHCWPEAFKTSDGKYLPIVNRGNSGTYSTEQSNNLESYIAGKPKKVFMMIGTNDIATSGGLNFSGEQVLQYVKSIVERIHMRSPETKVYLYSILNNSTGNRVEATWLHPNEIVKAYVESKNEEWLKYIDLYDKLTGIAQGGVWSYDKLHLTAAAYKVWCETICEYLAEGETYTVSTVYPENTSSVQNNGGLGGAHGMRATYFSMMPVSNDDILVFGDEFIKNARREAESMRRAAEEHARHMVEEQEIVRMAKLRANELLETAEQRSRELRKAANDYVDDALRRTEEAVSTALDEVSQSRIRFRSAAGVASEAKNASKQQQIQRVSADELK